MSHYKALNLDNLQLSQRGVGGRKWGYDSKPSTLFSNYKALLGQEWHVTIKGTKEGYDSKPSYFPTTMCHMAMKVRREGYDSKTFFLLSNYNAPLDNEGKKRELGH